MITEGYTNLRCVDTPIDNAIGQAARGQLSLDDEVERKALLEGNEATAQAVLALLRRSWQFGVNYGVGGIADWVVELPLGALLESGQRHFGRHKQRTAGRRQKRGRRLAVRGWWHRRIQRRSAHQR